MNKDNTKSLSKVIRIDESDIRGQFDEIVRDTLEELHGAQLREILLEETLNSLLASEADMMCNTRRTNIHRTGLTPRPVTTDASSTSMLASCC